MSADRIEDLWTRFLAEGRLDDAEEQELLRALQSDLALRKRLLQDKQFDGLLDAIHASDQEAFARSFQDRLAVEGDPSKFIAKVEERIRTKPRRTAPPPSRSWAWALVAAGVFAALLLIVMSSGSEPAAPVVKRADPPKPRVLPVPEEKPAPVVVSEKPKEVPKPVFEPPKPPPPPPPVPAPKPEEPKPEPTPPPAPAPAPQPKVTEVIVARVDDARDLAAGQGVDGKAVVAYPDGTKLDLAADTTTREYFDAAKGKTLTLEKGILTADVVRQPQGRPMIVKTPHAEARVVGTAFRLSVDGTSTRLDVMSGKVRLTRSSDGRFTDVSAGQFAVAGAGLELSAKSSAPKPKPVLLQENFQDPVGLSARWRVVGATNSVKVTSGALDIDLAPKSPGPNGWGGGGLQSRQTFATPMAVSLDVEMPLLSASVVAAVVFIPQGGKRGAEGVFRIQLRDARYTITTESGQARDLAGADRAGGAPVKERWRIEVDGADLRFLVDDREVLKHKHDLPAAPGYSLGIDGSVRMDAPSGAKAGFDNVVVEPLK